MNGEELLRRHCKNVGLDFDSTFYVKSSQVALHPGKRIQQKCEINELDEVAYVVRYFPDDDIFFAWRYLRGRNSCSFKVPEDYSIQPGTVRKDTKTIGDGSGRKETVYSFFSKDINKFLEEVIL